MVYTRGLPLAFGTFEAFYAEDFLSDHSPSSIAWIGTMQNFLLVRAASLFLDFE